MDYPEKELTEQIIGAAIEVHRYWGPGLLESVYEKSLVRDKVVVELKVVKNFEPIHEAQLLTYMKITQ